MDNIKKPLHYNKGGIEPIDYIVAKQPYVLRRQCC
jgi:hypothetical protein